MGRIRTRLKNHAGWAAFLLIAIIGSPLIWEVLKPGQPDLPRFERLQAKQTDYYPGGGQCRPTRPRPPANGEDALERQRCADAAEDHRLKEDDLRQQARSADAAEAIVWLTYKQSTTLVVGTILGFLTWVAAMAAAWYAGRAAQASFQIADLETRPILSLGSVLIKDVNAERYTLTVCWTNIGRVPAIVTGGQPFRHVSPFGGGDPTLDQMVRDGAPMQAEVLNAVIAPGESYKGAACIVRGCHFQERVSVAFVITYGAAVGITDRSFETSVALQVVPMVAAEGPLVELAEECLGQPLPGLYPLGPVGNDRIIAVETRPVSGGIRMT